MSKLKVIRWLISTLLAALLGVAGVFAQPPQSVALRGRVVDEMGAVVVGAQVTAVNAQGVEKSAVTNSAGDFVIPGLAPGRFTLRANMTGFASSEVADVEATTQSRAGVEIRLSAALAAEHVEVKEDDRTLDTDPSANANSLTLRGADLDVLPDDPDQLAAALLALAGPSAGPDGGQIILDGFTGGRLPPKESIREIRINKNPFSTEFDRLGYGRVEVLTRPGSESRYRGQASFNFNDESLNARNPFAAARRSSQSRLSGFSFNGPIVPKRASFFLDFQRREIDDNALIVASVLDPSLSVVRLSQIVLTPQRFTTFSPRFDFQLNANHTLTARYSLSRWDSENDGVGEFSLLTRAFDSTRTQQVIQLSETAIINERVINESRFQFTRDAGRQEGDNSLPTIRVPEAFIGGGSAVGLSTNTGNRFELHNITSWVSGQHSLRGGVRLRAVGINDVSRSNFNGTFTFATLEQYRGALLGLPGARPTIFSVNAGDPSAQVSGWDAAGFIQDDWRMRPNLTVNFGLRYERQNNISSNLNFAPRFGFAWAPGASATRQPRTIVRGGVGLFYERFGEELVLLARRFDGTSRTQYVVSEFVPGGSELLSRFPNVSTAEELAQLSVPQSAWRAAADLHAPYLRQSSIGIERQMPFKLTLSATFINTHMVHALRARNLGGGLPGAGVAGGGRVYLLESSGRFNQNQLIISVNNRFNKRMTLFGSYVLNKADSDTDGAQNFPANSLDLRTEYGPSSLDVRHRFTLSGFINLPLELSLTPFVIASTGRPFNITSGNDANGDTLFTDRPALADDLSRPGVVVTRFGAFDPNPAPGAPIIPRNFGRGTSFLSVNLGIGRTFKFGKMPRPKSSAKDKNNPLGALLDSVGSPEKRFELTLSLRAQNLFNRTNSAAPVGNLNSPLFGQATQSVGAYGSGLTTTGNRRLEGQVRLSF